LKSAAPRLLLFVKETDDEAIFSVEPHISDNDISWDEIFDEGFDPDYSPLGPVYWRVIRRGKKKFYYSTFAVSRDQIISGWGAKGLSYCDPITGIGVARIVTLLDK
jgi:hypothetical protein